MNTKIGDWVVYKNNQLIAFNKPATIPIQEDKTGDKSLLLLAGIYCKSKVHLIHRIDRPASGLVLFAKTPNALRFMNAQFQNRQVKKFYWAVVQNRPAEDSGKLIHFLKKKSSQNRSYAYDEEVAGSKKAEMKYRLLGSSDKYHLLEVELISGRHHQIRAQLAAIDCPIKGDVKYGFRRGNRDRSIHLHARKMVFEHPTSGEEVELVSEPNLEDAIWSYFVEKGL